MESTIWELKPTNETDWQRLDSNQCTDQPSSNPSQSCGPVGLLQDFVLQQLAGMQGVRVQEPQGAFYVLPDCSALCGPHAQVPGFGSIPDETCKVPPATRDLLSFSKEYKTGATTDLDVVDLSIRFRESTATQTHDRIYAFYGLFPESRLPALQVDYSRSIIWVFADYTAHYIHRTQSLRILALAETYGLSFPSWSVNFNFYVVWSSLLLFVDHWESSQLRPERSLSDISELYNASGGRSANDVQYEPEHWRLTVSGWCVDTVKDVACPVRSRFISSIRSWEGFVQSYSIDW